MTLRAQLGRSMLAAAMLLLTGSAAAVELRGAGAAFAAPLVDAWIAAYTERHDQVDITFDAVGSGVGVQRFFAGEVHFGASDAVLDDAEAAALGGAFAVVPAAGGTIALAYNLPDVPSGLVLSREVLAGIFLGEITDWQDPRIVALNPEADLPGLTITLVTRRDPAGSTAAFTRHLSAVSPAWRERYGAARLIAWPGLAMSATGENGVAELIAASWGAIGYVETGTARRAELGLARLENAAGRVVAPAPQSGRAALADSAGEPHALVADPDAPAAYPIVNVAWLMVRHRYLRPAVRAALYDFAEWGLRDGQALVADLGYAPLPAPVAERARRTLARAR
jgi:phosphate transport system substrate-binding protein